MNKTPNPHPEFITDEASGIEVRNQRHKDWQEGYEAGRKDERDSKG